jgi:hypothetical protein
MSCGFRALRAKKGKQRRRISPCTLNFFATVAWVSITVSASTSLV